MASSLKVLIKLGAVFNGLAGTFNLRVPSTLSTIFQLCTGLQLLRLVAQRRLRAFLTYLTFAVKLQIVKEGAHRSLLGHVLFDLQRAYSRYKLNLPPSMLLKRRTLEYGPMERHKADLAAARMLGPIVSANRFAPMGTRTFIFLSDPDAVEKVMTDKVTYPSRGNTGFSDTTPYGLLGLPSGALHTKHRRLIGKFMTNRYLESFSNIIEEETEILVDKWVSAAEKGQVSEVCYDLSMITLQVIMRVSVGTTGSDVNYQHVDEKDNQDYHDLDYALKEIMISTAFPFLGLHPTLRLRGIRKRIENSQQIIWKEAEKKLSSTDPTSNIYAALKSLGKGDMDSEDAMSDKEIMDEMLTVRGAGHETTSHTLCWCLLLLSRNPECMQKLQQEVSKIKGKTATYDDVKDLQYTHMVIYEALRLYPTVPSFPREAAVDTKILGYDIPEKSLVFVCQNAMNRNEKIWQKPDEFDPERFRRLPELQMSKPIGVPGGHQYGFIPFGAGNRTCVGQRLAMLEAVIMLASVAKNLNWELAYPEKEISEVADITLGPKEGLDVLFHVR